MNATMAVINKGFEEYGEVNNWPEDIRKKVHETIVGYKGYLDYYTDTYTEEFKLVKKLVRHGYKPAEIKRRLWAQGYTSHQKYWFSKQQKVLKQTPSFTYQLNKNEAIELEYYLERKVSKKQIAIFMDREIAWVDSVTKKHYPKIIAMYNTQLELF